MLCTEVAKSTLLTIENQSPRLGYRGRSSPIEISTMLARLLLLSIVVLSCSIDVHAGVHIWIETEYDELGAREDCRKRPDISKRQVMLERLERKLLEGLASKADLLEKYGDPKPFDITNCVRPIGAHVMVFPENVRSNEIDGLMDRSLYFELNKQSGILVLVDVDGKPYLPAVLLWRIDDKLPRMTDAALCDNRLEWEASRLDSVLKIAGVDQSDLTPTDEEMRRNNEATVRIQKRVEQLRRTKP